MVFEVLVNFFPPVPSVFPSCLKSVRHILNQSYECSLLNTRRSFLSDFMDHSCHVHSSSRLCAAPHTVAFHEGGITECWRKDWNVRWWWVAGNCDRIAQMRLIRIFITLVRNRTPTPTLNNCASSGGKSGSGIGMTSPKQASWRDETKKYWRDLETLFYALEEELSLRRTAVTSYNVPLG